MEVRISSIQRVALTTRQCWKAQQSGRYWQFRAPLIWGKHRSIRSGIDPAWPLSIFLKGLSFGNRRWSCFVRSLGLVRLVGRGLGSFGSEPSRRFHRVYPIVPWTPWRCSALEFCLGRGGPGCWSTSSSNRGRRHLQALVSWKSCRWSAMSPSHSRSSRARPSAPGYLHCRFDRSICGTGSTKSSSRRPWCHLMSCPWSSRRCSRLRHPHQQLQRLPRTSWKRWLSRWMIWSIRRLEDQQGYLRRVLPYHHYHRTIRQI